MHESWPIAALIRAFLLTGLTHDGEIISMTQMVIGDVVLNSAVAANLALVQRATYALGA